VSRRWEHPRVRRGRGAFGRVDDRGARDDGAGEAHAQALEPLRMWSRGHVAEVEGFNPHAGVCVAGDDRDALERLRACGGVGRPSLCAAGALSLDAMPSISLPPPLAVFGGSRCRGRAETRDHLRLEDHGIMVVMSW